MELTSQNIRKFNLPEAAIREFYCKEIPKSFVPSLQGDNIDKGRTPSLLTIDLNKTLEWLHGSDEPRQLEFEVCDVPVLLFGSNFSVGHLLFHYDRTSNSKELIRNFIVLFRSLIQDSKATIISPGFIPKSKIREEQEIIELVASSTKETSFIKFNFSQLEDFWSYGMKHDCTLLVTTKSYQADLIRIFFQASERKVWEGGLSFYLSL